MKAEIKNYLEKQKLVFEATRDNAQLVIERTKPQPETEAPKKPTLKEIIAKAFTRSPNIDKAYNEARIQLNTAEFNVNQLEKCIVFIDAIKE